MITPRHQFCFTFHYVSILIVYRPGCFNASMTFTFHYVSILIMIVSSILIAVPLFTFHYVSILIGVTLSTGAWIEILHSIMFLFNALWLYHRKPLLCFYILFSLYFNGQINRIKKFRVRLYIPLCFYSN